MKRVKVEELVVARCASSSSKTIVVLVEELMQTTSYSLVTEGHSL